MVGGQSSLELGFSVGIAGTVLGLLYGAISGVIGGYGDAILMRIIDTLLAVPTFILLIIVASMFSLTLGVIIAILSLLSWPSVARLVRGQVLALRTREFSEAARTMGASRWWVLIRHMVPNTLGICIVTATFGVADAIYALSALSFLGIGPPPPFTDWGTMLTNGVNNLFNGYWWQVYPPMFVLVLVVIAFRQIGDALNDILSGGQTGRVFPADPGAGSAGFRCPAGSASVEVVEVGTEEFGLRSLSPEGVRARFRAGVRVPTAGCAAGFSQANLVVVPEEAAAEFEQFVRGNPKPCPLLDITDPGSPVTVLAPGADLRTDLPAYRVWEYGRCVAEPGDITGYWRGDLVAFLLGCSFTFERALLVAGVPVRHIEQGRIVPMFATNRPCEPCGRFTGPLVCSMRPIPAGLVAKAIEVTAASPAAHGAPVHVGDPAELGILDLSRPDFGDPVRAEVGDVPVFWACGVTPQMALANARLPFAITHAPGHMFITDVPDTDLNPRVRA